MVPRYSIDCFKVRRIRLWRTRANEANMNDPIADMLTRIRNAQAVGHATVRVLHSKILEGIAATLARNGFIGGFEKKGRTPDRYIEISLRSIDGHPAIEGLRRVSKPGQRVYRNIKRMGRVRYGTGVTILSTPQGILTDKEARIKKVGGEVLCEVW